MVFLRVAAHLVGVQLLILLGTLAGGVLLGVLPALVAGSGLLSALLAGAPSAHLWREFWAAWRAAFRPSLTLGLPVGVVVLVLLADVVALGAAPAATAAAMRLGLYVVGAYLLVALAFLVPTVRRYPGETAPATWRFVAVMPLVLPGTSLVVLLELAAWALLVIVYPWLGLLAGLSVPLAATGWVIERRLQRLDDDRGSTPGR